MDTKVTKARIENSLVVEVLALENWDDVFSPELVWVQVPTDQNVKCGWLYDGTFHSPTTPPPVPEPLRPLSARQIRLALAAAGLLDQVEMTIAGLPQASRIEWQYASSYERTHPLIASIGTAVNLSDGQIDDMWRQAEAL